MGRLGLFALVMILGGCAADATKPHQDLQQADSAPSFDSGNTIRDSMTERARDALAPRLDGQAPDGRPVDAGPDDAPFVAPKSFTLLSYNIQGLPVGLSSSNPTVHVPIISPMLNRYDIVVIQEDYVFYDALHAATTHLYQSPATAVPLGKLFNDGLDHLSAFPVSSLQREMWAQCSGFLDKQQDCFAGKGFSLAITELALGSVLHVYNLHMDSGRDPDDWAARSAQIDQLIAAIANRSTGKAVIIAGDTNLRLLSDVDDAGLFARLKTATKMQDTCTLVSCTGAPLDRVLFRSGAGVNLTLKSRAIDESFVNFDGEDLSDHKALAVEFDWKP